MLIIVFVYDFIYLKIIYIRKNYIYILGCCDRSKKFVSLCCGDTMQLKVILGKNVKYHRYRKKLTQERLAEIINVSSNYVGRLERGQHNPSLEKIDKISKALGIKAFELFVERDDYNSLPDRVNLVK